MQEGEQGSSEKSGALDVLKYTDYFVPIQGAEGCPFAVGTSCLSWCLMFLRELQMLQGSAGYLLCGAAWSPWACDVAATW